MRWKRMISKMAKKYGKKVDRRVKRKKIETEKKLEELEYMRKYNKCPHCLSKVIVPPGIRLSEMNYGYRCTKCGLTRIWYDLI